MSKLHYEHSEEVAHIWASIGADAHAIYSRENRTRVGVYRNNSFLYSYNTKIAKIDLEKNVVLLSTKTYSNTTTKHQKEAQTATWHKAQIFIPCVEDNADDNFVDYYRLLSKLLMNQDVLLIFEQCL